ncbi:hypothetical protein GIY30_23820 [Gordonia sp. HNM0687]|uniref:Uncharacterized protein n=1 Tax=Gordonia mangrovi TaxID=2665643 RepID=A0A6L7GW98_9ACTN|nr:hypothetical protein [Gordonia mangrovi]MXP24354.1 hypothetical protein [Gordonia mangrovi]UVF80031.1 hypothetical protein NWF22_09495 [Gordonia mangrovi]
MTRKSPPVFTPHHDPDRILKRIVVGFAVGVTCWFGTIIVSPLLAVVTASLIVGGLVGLLAARAGAGAALAIFIGASAAAGALRLLLFLLAWLMLA